MRRVMEAFEMERRLKEENEELRQQVRQCREALTAVNQIVAEAAGIGFNYQVGDWAERLFFSQQKTSQALRDTKDV